MKQFQVQYRNFQWELQHGSSRDPLAVFDLKRHAVEFAKLYARHHRGVLRIEDPDHPIEVQRDYSQDPKSPGVKLVFARSR